MLRIEENDVEGILELRCDVNVGSLPRYSSDSLVESVCCKGIQIIFIYDALPMRSISTILYSSHAPPFAFRSNPIRLRCLSEDNALKFEILLDRTRAPSGCTVYTGNWKSSSTSINGCLCDLEWDDGGVSCGTNNEMFKIGAVGSGTAGCVEGAVHLDWTRCIETSRCVSFYRHREPFWMIPSYHCAITQCRDETQFLLVEMRSACNSGLEYVAAAALIDPVCGLRSSLFGNEQLCIRVESGLQGGIPLKRLNNVRVLSVTRRLRLHDAVKSTLSSAAASLGTFSIRSEKLDSREWAELAECTRQPVLSGLGWCSWDAFGLNVCEEDIVRSVSSICSAGIPLRYVIVDDGWQDGGCQWESPDSLDRPPLRSFSANAKFGGSLKRLHSELNLPLYAWLTIIGYWGGVASSCDDIRPLRVTGLFGKGLQCNDPRAMSFWKKNYSVVIDSRVEIGRFLQSYYQTMKTAGGIYGLKIDGQALLEGLCNHPQFAHTKFTRTQLCQTYREALESEYLKTFDKALVLNCMCASNDVIYLSGARLNPSNVLWRVTCDHAYPDCEETAAAVAWHVLSNGLNCIWLGEIFPVCDSDMFRCVEWHSTVHAVLRVISGGPVYISDRFPVDPRSQKDATKLLSRFLTQNGILLRCLHPGRACCDSVFSDPRDELRPYLFKMWNINHVNGAVAVFNLSSCADLGGLVSPVDVLDFDIYGVDTQSFVSFSTAPADTTPRISHFHLNKLSPVCLTLKPMEAVLLHICPVFLFEGCIKLAALGDDRMLNAGAVISSVSELHTPAKDHVNIKVVVLDNGVVRFWLPRESRKRFCCAHAGTSVIHHEFTRVGEWTFLDVDVAQVESDRSENNNRYGILLHFQLGDDLQPCDGRHRYNYA